MNMQQYSNGYLFSKDERYVGVIAVSIIIMLFVLMGMILIFIPSGFHSVIISCMVVFAVSAICLGINHICNKKYRFAQYIISDAVVALRLDSEEITISRSSSYFLSVLHLYRSVGKGYSYVRYIAFWQGKPPRENAHPIALLKQKRYVLLPYTTEVMSFATAFANVPNIPDYPRTIYHPARIES